MNDAELIAALSEAEAVLVVDPMRAGAYWRACSLRRAAEARKLDAWRVRAATDAAVDRMVVVFPPRRST